MTSIDSGSLALLLFGLVLATFRVTRLVTRDDFPPVLWLRTRVVRARPDRSRQTPDGWVTTHWWLGELVTCLWCASAYVSAALVYAAWLLVGMPLPVLVWLAVWGGGAFLADLRE